MAKEEMKQLVSDEKLFLAAKHAPGRFKAPFVTASGKSNLSTSTLKTTLTLNQVYDSQSIPVLQPIGTNDYLVIMFCPVMSVYYGGGGTGQIPSTSKIGGMWMRQISTSSQDVALFSNFWTVNRGAQTMSTLYGS